jgi:hypothetical protein
MKEEIKSYLTALLALILVTAAVSLVTTSTAHAGLFDSAMTSNWDTVESSRYKLDAYGYDARVYEWIPLDNPGMRCVFVASNESSGVGCYPAVEQ